MPTHIKRDKILIALLWPPSWLIWAFLQTPLSASKDTSSIPSIPRFPGLKSRPTFGLFKPNRVVLSSLCLIYFLINGYWIFGNLGLSPKVYQYISLVCQSVSLPFNSLKCCIYLGEPVFVGIFLLNLVLESRVDFILEFLYLFGLREPRPIWERIAHVGLS